MTLANFSSNTSIKVKLSIFIVLISTAFSWASYRIIHSTLHASLSRQQNEVVFDRLHMLRSIVEENADYLDIIGKDIKWEGEYIPFPAYYLRLIDERGRILVETPGMSTMIPVGWVPQPEVSSRSGHEDVIRQSQNGRYFFLKADSLAPPHGPAKQVTMQIALDVTSAVETDNQNHAKVVLLAIFRSLFFACLTIFVIRTVLRPLDQIVAFSEGITATNISERTSPEKWPIEIKRLGRAMNAMLDRLEEALTRLSQCASNMAHEIRTPINNLMGEAEIALLHDRNPVEYKKVLESSLEEYARLSRLVDNLLFLAHAENPSMSIERTLFDPVAEIEDIYSFFDPRAEEKGAELSCRGKVSLYADRLLFRRAITNLVTNALHYSADGVKIDISAEEVEGGVNVEVSDTGHGIDHEDLPKLFDRFFRGDASRSNYTEGAGLGLSIVKAIMDLHGGSITVASAFAKGSRFTLWFPSQSANRGSQG